MATFHENKKICKIVTEILLHLLMQDSIDINISVSCSEQDKTIITIKTNRLKSKQKEKLHSYLSRGRQLESEEYGYEIMGESDNSSDLEMLGLMIDSAEIVDVDDTSIITLVRNFK